MAGGFFTTESPVSFPLTELYLFLPLLFSFPEQRRILHASTCAHSLSLSLPSSLLPSLSAHYLASLGDSPSVLKPEHRPLATPAISSCVTCEWLYRLFIIVTVYTKAYYSPDVEALAAEKP